MPAAKPALASEPADFEVASFPNPFNPSTTIPYGLPEPCQVRLTIYSALGQTVRVLVDANQDVGYHSVQWDGRDAVGRQVTSGVYLYRLEAGENLAVRRMVLVR
ncbi:MAG: FlgD immunoglobulin-like domain containing protein [Candidatus Latescibacteria bacterium]|nr:FlgD immunoglobulin-like domain containing protein [Candidatus Latescibacterota bacterium]